jgi:hypothetical protein
VCSSDLWWLISSVRRSIGAPPAFVIFVLENDLPALPDPPRPLWQRFTARPRLSLSELAMVTPSFLRVRSPSDRRLTILV